MGKISLGIVGLPNVGKSTLFNALLRKQVADVANYPFCTIEPNVGVVEVPDERLPVLAKIVNTQKIIPAIVEFYDIAGLVKNASKGEGLGNKFLSHIREVAAIVHVVRLFEDSNVVHVSEKIEPMSDIKTIETELMLADLQTLEKQPASVKTTAGKKDPKGELFVKTVEKIKKALNGGVAVKSQNLSDEEIKIIKPLNLLTIKPVIYVFNVSEKQLENQIQTKEKIAEIVKLLNGFSNNYLYLNAKLETDVLAFSEDEQKEYLKQYNLTDTGLNRLIKKSYEVLGLISFLTARVKEVRAWTVTKGTLAPQAAGVIHTDFEKHFIKAEIIPYEDFVKLGGWVKAREAGRVSIVGTDYEVKDGEIVDFKVGV